MPPTKEELNKMSAEEISEYAKDLEKRSIEASAILKFVLDLK